uniref:Serpentine Receptor, class Z n=1 Tax=Panagrellus redivivus TaxID=6233 RepID=A0A7E4ZSG4_PANRE
MFDAETVGLHFYTVFFDLNYTGFSSVVIAVIFICDYIITDMLLVLLIDRYVTVSKTLISLSEWFYNGIYVFLAITNVIQSSLTIVVLIYIKLPPEVQLKYHIIEYLYLPLTACYQMSRLAGFITIIYLNFKFGKSYASKASANVIRLHKMLLRAVMANVLCTGFFTRLPMFVMFVALATRNFTYITAAMDILLWFQNCAFLSDMLTTLYFVVPFRHFVMTLLRIPISDCHLHPRSTVASFLSHA